MGLYLGMRHALEPDHLAAVGTCVPRSASPKRAATIGAVWGAGHSASILAIGGVVLALRGAMPEWIDQALEFAVGVMLVVLGVRAIFAARAMGDGGASAHTHAQPQSRMQAFGIGLVHGAAGTGGATILATGEMGGLMPGLIFLAVFGLGSVLGMAIIAGSLAMPVSFAASSRVRAGLLVLAGLISIVIGGYWMAAASGIA